MKKLLKWIFKEDWLIFKREMREQELERFERQEVAERALRDLGYKLEYENPVKFWKEGEAPTKAGNYGWKIKKIKQ